MRRGGTALALAVVVFTATVSAAPARSLNGLKATVQFNATMTTTWSLGPYTTGEETCFAYVTHGVGSQSVILRQPGHATVSIVDFGGTISFQLPAANRAGPTKRAVGFPLAHVERKGTQETEARFTKNFVFTNCPSRPETERRDESSCGAHEVTWDVLPLVASGRISPTVETFPPADIEARCPYYGVKDPREGGNATELPQLMTFQAITPAAVRRALSPRHGKLILQGKQTLHKHEESTGLSVTQAFSWKMTLRRS